ncbi:hypothetical protein P154DRAFT_65985 [Amniculicola lignicola CBS 123094]|uniref:P-loop containing nucleoside triphosphate hydrolase protein n=1 Tax=Amniculicola lignicola CBS 123094 TaxID=1392246 RepID=A0A6A5WYD2_9PLEO|nr:hypothetical protein P154DRAFT_65985 [Amniculicola lignicola CBS 123094]
MAGKANKRGRPGWQTTQGNRAHNRAGGTAASRNPFAGLAASENDDVDSSEMNAHLTERFVGGNGSRAYSDLARVPIGASRNLGIQEYFMATQTPVPAGGLWLQKPEIPTSSEILSKPNANHINIIDVGEDIRPNKPEGSFESVDDYLGTHYNLLREDAIRPLREAVEQVRGAPFLDESEYLGGASIGVYDPVHITAIVFSNRGLAVRVAFSLSRVKKYVRWEQSKRLITGTLVALSPADDTFQTKCIIATVAARPISALSQNPPEIDLFFARSDDVEIDPMRKWIMVECRASFFESSRHTMTALQHMAREPFPLSEHLVQAKQDVDPPEYVLKNPFTDMSPLVPIEESKEFENVNILQSWPSSRSHGLDMSQSAALKSILTNRLAVIQGPPGTGKTYVSVIALKILLANMRSGDSPIIVTCQTNHALDQILRHIAEFEPHFARMGGRSKDTGIIKARTLFELRQSMSQQKIGGSRKHTAMVEIKKLANKMRMLLSPLEQDKPLLSHKTLVELGLITQGQADSLEMEAQYVMGISPDTPGIQMEQWMGRCLRDCDRPLQPDDFGMEFEEDDFEVEQLKELEAEAFAQDDDFETLKGPYILLSDNKIGKCGGNLRTDADIRDVLKTTPDLNNIPPVDRGDIYNYFLRHTKRIILQEFRGHAKAYEKLVKQRQIGQWEQDDRILREQRVVGLTTTGLSKYRAAIANLKPKIVLVEEAAETLEAPVTSACLPSLEHLILVGDHQQLRPRCQVREFENKPYHLNLSLFERMVNNGIQMECLSRQRRMIPEIRKLLVPIYGDMIRDHASVTDLNNRPLVEGMGGCNSFFFTHEWRESRDGNQSALNEKEADMIVGFFNYLVFNNVNPSKITVLTFYNGQRKLLNKKLMTHPNLRAHGALNIVTVDSYQGEENDIVILSLVRSNKRGNIGFLSVDNRVCVALSRAKRGFYLFGNAEMLACESIIWSEVIEIMYGKKSKGRSGPEGSAHKHRVGYLLPLICSRHKNKTWIEEPNDWEYVNGGCDQACRCTLPCGHMCLLRCHP